MKVRFFLWYAVIISLTAITFIGCPEGDVDPELPSQESIHFDSGNGGWDEAWALALDFWGGAYIVGYGNRLLSGSTSLDWWLKRFYSNLDEYSRSWNKKITYENDGQDQAYDVAVDSSDNVYVVGYGNNIDGDGVAGSGHDWWIKKFDGDGTELDFGGSSLPAAGAGSSPCSTNDKDLVFDGNEATDAARAVVIDSADNVYVAGYGDNLVDASSFHDWWIKKFDSEGNELDFGGSVLPAAGIGNSPCSTNAKDLVFDGGSGDADVIFDIVVDADDNVYVIGSGNNLAGFSSDLDWWIKKFDSQGNELDFGGGGYPAAGSYDSPCTTNGLDAVFDSSGGITGFYDDRAWAGTIDAGGHLYVVGEGFDLVSDLSTTDWWIKKFDLNGDEELVAEKKIDDGSNLWEAAVSVAADTHNNVYVAGYGYNLINDSSNYDWWIKKFDSEGAEDIGWEKRLDGSGGADQPHCIAVGSPNSVYVVGYGSNLSGPTAHDWWIHRFDISSE
jgi:hypothetical protein